MKTLLHLMSSAAAFAVLPAVQQVECCFDNLEG